MMVNSSTENEFKAMTDFKENSKIFLDKMRAAAKDMFENPSNFIIGVNGSIARGEATSGSDVDLFFLSLDEDPESLKPLGLFQSQFGDKLNELGLKPPAKGGVFEVPHSTAATLKTIGGQNDSNETITRRMLILLEGEWIYNKAAFLGFRSKLIDQYVPDDIEDKKICLFLLNDIIRYWRTICVDFEYKTVKDSKPRAIRVIKLRFSRMLLYFAGVLAVAETYNKNPTDKKAELEKLLAIPPVERVQKILGSKSKASMDIYAEFLISLDDDKIRKKLENSDGDGEETEEFKNLVEKARKFKNELILLLINHYKSDNLIESDNPIVRALLF